MVSPEIMEEKPIGLLDLKSELAKIRKRDKELTSRSLKLEDYLNHFVTMKKEDHKKLQNELEALNVPRIKDVHIIKIMDIMPATVEEVKIIFQEYAITVSSENMKKIVGVVTKFIPK